MKHYALVIEYQGSNYCGWQKQTHSLGIQAVLEKALSAVADESVTLICAGRTDAGVHATSQVASFKTKAVRDNKAWLKGTNASLPEDIKIRAVYSVFDDFNARFSALYRRYQYLIYQDQSNTALWHQHSLWIDRKLDIEKMNHACRYLLGEQDFSAFRSSQCQSHSSKRNIHHACFKTYGRWLVFDIQGNAFLHHMVRNITGSMLKVGLGEQEPIWMQDLLKAKDRTIAGKTAPAKALYLVEVGYPEKTKVVAKNPLETLLSATAL